MNFKKLTIAVFLLTLLLNSGCTSEKEAKNSSGKTLPEVEVQEIGEVEAKEFVVIGEVFPDKESVQTAKAPSDVVEIFVKIGDKVKADQSLAKLSSDDLNENYRRAQNSYSNALSTYNKTVSSGNRSVESSQIALDNAKRNLENTKKTAEAQKNEAAQSLSQTKTSTELSIAQAKQSYENAKINAKESENSARIALSNTLNNARISVTDTLDDVDQLLGIEERNEEGAEVYEKYLGTLDPSKKIAAQDFYRKTKTSLSSTNFSSTDSAVQILKSTRSTVLAMVELLENSSTWSTNEISVSLSNQIGTFNSLANSIQTTLNSVETAKSNLETSLASNSTSIEIAKKSLELAQMNANGESSEAVLSAERAYERSLASLESNIESMENNVRSSEIALENTKESVKLQTANAKTALDSAKSALNSAKIALDDLLIKAPFDGEVSDLFVEKGEELGNGTKVVSVSDNTRFKIVAYLSKNQVKGISAGDEVRIATKSFDKIYSISSKADSNTKKHKVEILHKNPFLSSGQFVNLTFTPKKEKIASSSDEIFLTLPAVFVDFNGDYVYVVDEENKIQKREVGLGGISGNLIEIKSGIEKGDRVVISGGRNLKEGQKVKAGP